ncbi:COX15/CtaA family protein [Methylosinus sp. Sm6]|uniref:COX15/CtaA family protein n=1 Tax=Methylosinus sp. Sm6 TaxID=2866948 RepID=UPI001C99F163|nr:COX15/CtaA family protein [Methylosinus sp. Sm6]MBY6240634.1 COX15/CtaA family protein [Methylosinus sp. Sm6]
MTEWIHFPAHTPAIVAPPSEETATDVRLWLWIVAGLVVLMVIVGGATRLTESGLSITQWKPISGVLPPLSEAQWSAAFEDYKKIPQYREMFPDMELARFKVIYAWEWSHRLLGRLIGVAFALPLAFFWLRGRLPRRLKPKLIGILALGALQGAVGWWMVSSGLAHRVEVVQERLAIHLLLAALIFSSCLWVAAGLGPQRPLVIEHGRKRLSAVATLLLVLVFVQLGAGALVAGLRAGLIYNTWPLMDGAFVPPAEALLPVSPWWLNVVDTGATVQFDHRMLAYLLLALSLLHLVDAEGTVGGRVGRGAGVLFGHIGAQAALGIATVLLAAPLWAALSHQALAMGVLAIATLHARRLRAAVSSSGE